MYGHVRVLRNAGRRGIYCDHSSRDELGVTFLDTADTYGYGDNEVLVGKAIRGLREKVFLATKFGIVRDKSNPSVRGVNGKPEYVRASCDASLKRLGVETIDLYYQHALMRPCLLKKRLAQWQNL